MVEQVDEEIVVVCGHGCYFRESFFDIGHGGRPVDDAGGFISPFSTFGVARMAVGLALGVAGAGGAVRIKEVDVLVGIAEVIPENIVQYLGVRIELLHVLASADEHRIFLIVDGGILPPAVVYAELGLPAVCHAIVVRVPVQGIGAVLFLAPELSEIQLAVEVVIVPAIPETIKIRVGIERVGADACFICIL